MQNVPRNESTIFLPELPSNYTYTRPSPPQYYLFVRFVIRPPVETGLEPALALFRTPDHEGLRGLDCMVEEDVAVELDLELPGLALPSRSSQM